MNFLEKLKQRMSEVNAAIQDVVDENIATDAVKEERMDICRACDHYFAPTNQCKKCGCFLKAKTAVNAFSCPIDKWKAITITKVPHETK